MHVAKAHRYAHIPRGAVLGNVSGIHDGHQLLWREAVVRWSALDPKAVAWMVRHVTDAEVARHEESGWMRIRTRMRKRVDPNPQEAVSR